MTSEPQFTVIINCYNSDKYLRETIDSVLNQTFIDWEIIFWDNQSTDNSAQVVSSYSDSRIRYFYAPRHTTLGEARRLAIANARGKWICLLDCDDVWLPHKLSTQAKILAAEEDVGLIYSDMMICNEKLELLELGSARYQMHRGYVWKNLLTQRNFIPCPSATMRRDLVQQLGSFNPRLKYCEEYDLFLRIARVSKIEMCPEPLVKYRLHQKNTTGLGNLPTTWEYLQVNARAYVSNLPGSITIFPHFVMRQLILLLKGASQFFRMLPKLFTPQRVACHG